MTNTQVHGKGNILATVIADSISPDGTRLTTFEVQVHRMIWAEVMTHRKFSRNAASTRAVPVAKVIEQVTSQCAMPISWGMNNPGMKSKVELSQHQQQVAESLWLAMRDEVTRYCKVLANKDGINGHKQWVGRPLEPFTMMKAVITATDFANFLYLRDHPDAQPEIREMARTMAAGLKLSTPRQLKLGQWHLPYITTDDQQRYWAGDQLCPDLETARKVSASCCAQVSYRTLDTSIEKAIKIYDMLHLDDGSGEPAHASPVEHQATPIDTINTDAFNPSTWAPGITHVDRQGALWSGNLRGWIQHRQLISNESIRG